MRLGIAVLSLLLFGAQAHAQSLRLRTTSPSLSRTSDDISGFLRYSALTDYAESEQPRAYTQSLRAGMAYKLDDNWSVSGDASLRFETFNGQIDKGPEETKTETLNPSVGLELDYEHSFMETHSYTFFVHGEPLLDQPSRLEGYKGLVGGGASLNLGFFKKRYALEQILDVSELINTFKYATDTAANPDMFYTYKLVNSVRLFANCRLAYTWGLKVTRYMDDFYGYSYSNTLSLSTAWRKFTLALAYDNGGFTDNGEVSLWYIDHYRRVGIASVSFAF